MVRRGDTVNALLSEPIGTQIVAGAATLGALIYIAQQAIKATRKVMAFFHRIDKALNNVEQQLYENGGASLRDAVNRIQLRLGIENVKDDKHEEMSRETGLPGA